MMETVGELYLPSAIHAAPGGGQVATDTWLGVMPLPNKLKMDERKTPDAHFQPDQAASRPPLNRGQQQQQKTEDADEDEETSPSPCGFIRQTYCVRVVQFHFE